MSAYIVSRSHIATLAFFAFGGAHKIGASQFGGLVVLANELAAENAKSVNYRYPGDQVEPFEFTERSVLKFARMDLAQNPVVILKAISCLKYQSCEHPTWKESQAYLALAHMQSAAIRMLPGYNEAEGWSIDDEVAPRKPAAVLVVLKPQGGVQ
jgi:hypothetical protein